MSRAQPTAPLLTDQYTQRLADCVGIEPEVVAAILKHMFPVLLDLANEQDTSTVRVGCKGFCLVVSHRPATRLTHIRTGEVMTIAPHANINVRRTHKKS
jgi:hypothetical protein